MPEPETPWYRSFFEDAYLRVYGHLLTPERAEQETAFMCRALGLETGDAVLDLCCGTGRHAVRFAQRGLRVTGLDLNPEYLAAAAAAARAVGVDLELVESDMREVPFQARFDAAVNLFTAFGYFEDDTDNLRVLEALRSALKPGGRLALDLLSREWLVRHHIPREWWEADGRLFLEERSFDLGASRSHVRFVVVEPDGTRRAMDGHHIRVYALHELRAMLAAAGLRFLVAHGGFNGEPYDLDARRLIVIAERPANAVS